MGPPTGGPEDKTAPTVLSAYPPSGSVQVDPQTVVEFTFSEAMDPASVAEGLFISPVSADKPKLKWRGHSVRVIPPQPLTLDQTIVYTLGTGVKDVHGNRLSESFTLAFTTGDSLDCGVVNGSVFSAEPAAGMVVGAWLGGDTSMPNPAVNLAAYFTQVDERGKYSLSYLKQGVYRLFCWNDKNHDRLYNIDAELLGITWGDSGVDNDTTFDLDFQPVKRDTSRARLLMVTAPDNRHLILRFNRSPEEGAGKLKKLVSVSDSLGNKLAVREAWRDMEDSARIYLQTVIQAAERSYWITWEGDTAATRFIGSSLADTISPQPIVFSPKNGDRNVAGSPSGWVAFDDALLPWNFELVFCLTIDSLDLPLETSHSAPNVLYWKADTLLPAGRNCKLQLNLTGIRDLAGNAAADSIMGLNFSILDPSRLGSISGSVESQRNYPIVVTAQLLTFPKSRLIKTSVNSERGFKLVNLTPGPYLLGAFEDCDSNGIYSPGSLMPFDWAERFIYLPDTIQVRERWETGGIILQFKE